MPLVYKPGRVGQVKFQAKRNKRIKYYYEVKCNVCPRKKHLVYFHLF